MLYRAMELTLGRAIRGAFRPEVTGVHHVPHDGAVILVGNHASFVDEFFLPIGARRQVFFFAKAEYFTTPGLRGRAMAAFFNGMGQVPVERGDARAAAGAIDVGVRVLAEGKALGIFPEGTRSRDGRLHKFRTGVARIAMRSGAPVVPVGLVGTGDVQRPGERRVHRAPVGVHFGQPLGFGDLAGQERSARMLRSVTEQIREAVQALSGQDYDDDYGSAVKLAD